MEEAIMQKLDDLIEMVRQLTLRIKSIETEVKNIRDRLPERLGNLINKAEKFDTEVSKKLQEDLITPHIRKKGTYQKGSFDEQLIEMFYKKEQERKGKLKEKEKPATSKEELKEEINEDE